MVDSTGTNLRGAMVTAKDARPGPRVRRATGSCRLSSSARAGCPPGKKRGWSLAPAVPPSALPRPKLEERLDEARSRRLTAVVAGAGFGKSTLLAAWAAGVNCSWYRVTAEDAELGALAAGIVHALRLRLPGLAAEVAAADAPRSRGRTTTATRAPRAQAYAGLLGGRARRAADGGPRARAGRHPRARARRRVGALRRGALPRGAGALPPRARLARRAAVPDRPAPRPGPGARARRPRARVHRGGDRAAARRAARRRRRRARRQAWRGDRRLAGGRPARDRGAAHGAAPPSASGRSGARAGPAGLLFAYPRGRGLRARAARDAAS